MSANRRCKGQEAAARQFPPACCCPGRQCPALLLALLLAAGLVSQLGSATAAGAETARSTPRAADFPALADAYRPIGDFLLGNTIVVGEGVPAETSDPGRSCDPIPALARVLAFEESDLFICATADASQAIGTSQAGQEAQADPGQPAFVRRVLFLKPSILVIDDVVRPTASAGSLQWQVRCRSAATVAGRKLRIPGPGQELVCETLWPATGAFRKTPGPSKESESVFQVEVKPEANANGVRLLHVLQLRPAGEDGAPAKTVFENKDDRFELVITTPDRTFRLSLPPPGADPGRIAVEAADGKTIVARRPLPAGVLPHGPEGVRLIERWDRAYRDGRQPGWDTGLVAEDLKQAVEEGVIRPCRTVVLGCGSGTNAVYLAGKGFDVTAIDVAPTALSIAEAKAEKAGVRVRWLLADVLAPPELEPFDFIFDRGCYHNVRYVDAAAFVESVRRLSRPGTRFLILSLNRDGPPGVREHHMRSDFSSLFAFQWLRDSGIRIGKDGATRRESWSLMLRRKEEK